MQRTPSRHIHYCLDPYCFQLPRNCYPRVFCRFGGIHDTVRGVSCVPIASPDCTPDVSLKCLLSGTAGQKGYKSNESRPRTLLVPTYLPLSCLFVVFSAIMVNLFSQIPKTSTLVVGGQEYPEVKWWKHKSLIHLHFLCAILLLSSATNGYDGSMSISPSSTYQWTKVR